APGAATFRDPDSGAVPLACGDTTDATPRRVQRTDRKFPKTAQEAYRRSVIPLDVDLIGPRGGSGAATLDAHGGGGRAWRGRAAVRDSAAGGRGADTPTAHRRLFRCKCGQSHTGPRSALRRRRQRPVPPRERGATGRTDPVGGIARVLASDLRRAPRR